MSAIIPARSSGCHLDSQAVVPEYLRGVESKGGLLSNVVSGLTGDGFLKMGNQPARRFRKARHNRCDIGELTMERQGLSCMDVWGGSQATFTAFEKAGLEIWLYSRPCKEDLHGGDVYYLSSCASGRITRMLVADVAGHGEGVGHLASQLRNLMRRYINSIRPQRLFEEVNADFANLPRNDRFATSIVHSYFMPTSTLSICNAGHPPPLIRRAHAEHWQTLEFERRTDDVPFGVLDSSKYTQLDLPVSVGDLVLCYTDGVIESSTADRGQLGISGLLSMVNELAADRPDRILPAIVEQIAAGSEDGSHDDDVTILLYRVTDSPILMRDNLAAPFRWLKSLFLRS